MQGLNAMNSMWQFFVFRVAIVMTQGRNKKFYIHNSCNKKVLMKIVVTI